MSTTREFHDYVMENLRRAAFVTSRPMMGEYCLYCGDKVAGLICDNCLFIKMTPSGEKLLPDAERAFPYEGSKTLMFVVDNFEDTDLMHELFEKIYDELPSKNKR